MPGSTSLISDAAGVLIAMLYTLAGQAHFTDRITPDLASKIEAMTRNSYAAFWFLNLDYLSLKRTFGAFDLVAAALLCQRQTRKIGLVAAVVGFSGGLYGQLHSNGDVGQVSVMLGLAVVGLLFAP